MSEVRTDGKGFVCDVAEHSDVRIGGDGVSFRPDALIRRWGDEAYLNWSFPTSRNVTPTFDGSKVVWSDSVANQEIRMYLEPPSAKRELGAFEYEIFLGALPALPTIPFTVESRGLNFYYQPATGRRSPLSGRLLDSAEIIHSYAAYHASKTQWHGSAAEADKYKTGKAFHMFRPVATDADGLKYALDYTVDRNGVPNGVDITALASARFPVVVDPTFGYTSVGGSTDCGGLSFEIYYQINGLSPSGSNTDMQHFVGIVNTICGAGATTVQFALFSEGTDLPNARLVVDPTTTSAANANAMVGGAAVSYALSASTQYWIGYIATAGGGVSISWDASTGTRKIVYTSNGGVFPTSVTGTSELVDNVQPSAYVYYEPAGGGLAMKIAMDHYKKMQAHS